MFPIPKTERNNEMLDIRYIKEKPDEVIARLAKKGKDAKEEIEAILDLDARRRALIAENEALKAEQNKTNKLIPQYKKEGKDMAALFAELKEAGARVKANDETLKQIETQLTSFMLGLPNLPDEDLLAGGKENNEPLRYHGEPRVFDFEPKNHVDLCTDLGLIDYKRGAKLSGNGFWIYSGMGARLEWAILNYFIDFHTKNNYQLMLVPHMLGYECGLTAGQFPKFQDDVYWLETAEDERRRFMLPTAETALVSLHRDEILTEADLPKKYISYTPCFRREAGSYRADERGMVRGHQFNKVEMVQYTLPEKSDEAFEELV
ncbi:MAG: serine--tRNA ligase, partial [Clostridia bacterium]|nr:serine--tRNA ligase [Clostridia bacterium]